MSILLKEAIDELIEMQVVEKRAQQENEHYYRLHNDRMYETRDKRSDAEMLEVYKADALNKESDPVTRVLNVKFYKAVQHKLEMDKYK